MAILASEFWDYVAVGDPDECWPWKGRVTKDGHGIVTLRASEARRLGIRATVGAYRLALMLETGGIPGGRKYACHRCNNPPCCNPGPKHLYWGTARDNFVDAVTRGTTVAFGVPTGSFIPRAGPGRPTGATVLSPEEVSEIRRVLETGHTHSATRDLARRFHVNPHTVVSAWKGTGAYAHRRFRNR